jgi:purine-binding chemotaxis protein CheW
VIKARQYCTFYVDGLLFGVEAEKVQEIVAHQELTRTPLAPLAVSGLINLRGQIVTAIDLRLRLELPGRTDTSTCASVVVRGDEGPVSLLVDSVSEVVKVSADAFESPLETFPSTVRPLIAGVYKLPDQLLLALSVEQALRVPAGPLAI